GGARPRPAWLRPRADTASVDLALVRRAPFDEPREPVFQRHARCEADLIRGTRRRADTVLDEGRPLRLIPNADVGTRQLEHEGGDLAQRCADPGADVVEAVGHVRFHGTDVRSSTV